jgi:hypothetical protein
MVPCRHEAPEAIGGALSADGGLDWWFPKIVSWILIFSKNSLETFAEVRIL